MRKLHPNNRNSNSLVHQPSTNNSPRNSLIPNFSHLIHNLLNTFPSSTLPKKVGPHTPKSNRSSKHVCFVFLFSRTAPTNKKKKQTKKPRKISNKKKKEVSFPPPFPKSFGFILIILPFYCFIFYFSIDQRKRERKEKERKERKEKKMKL